MPVADDHRPDLPLDQLDPVIERPGLPSAHEFVPAEAVPQGARVLGHAVTVVRDAAQVGRELCLMRYIA